MDLSQIESLIARYTLAWSEPDASKRMQHLEAVWEAEGVYTDPLSEAAGREALDAHIGTFLSDNPGAFFELSGQVEHHHQQLRFFWKMHLGNGSELRGMDYGEVSPGGKLSKIVGFFQY
jgi:hypothetical protein